MGRSYLYLINPQKSAVDVNKVLVLEVDSGRLTQDTVEFYLADKEMAVPNKIETKHIKGAFVAESTALTKEPHELSDLYEREVKPESFIRNPDYAEPYVRTIKTLKFASKGVMAVGIYLDTKSLFETYQRAEASGNYHLFFTEVARVSGGWTGAIALGHAWGAQGAGYVSRFTKSPGAILAGGVVGALVGSVVGYTGGGVIVRETYDRALNPYTLSIWTELYDTLKRLEPAHTSSSSVTIEAHEIKQPHELDVLFEKLNNFWEGFKQEIREEGSISGAIKKHLPAESHEKLSVMEALKRMDYNYLPESASARRAAEELFGDIQDNPLKQKHPSSTLLSRARYGSDDDRPSSLFKDASIDPVSATEDEASKQHAITLFKHAKMNHTESFKAFSHKKSMHPSQSQSAVMTPERHAELGKYYQKIYESTDRVRAIRESLKSGEQPLREMSLNQYCQMTTSCLGDAALIASRFKRPEAKILADLGTGIERIGAGNMMLQMASLAPEAAWMTPCGYFAIAAGVTVLLTMAFQSDDDAENDAMFALMQGIHQLGQMLQQVLENQEKIHGTLQVTLNNVLAVEARLKQHQAETRASLGFISTLELQNACLSLQGDLTKSNTVSLTKDARRQALSTLENWLKQHLFAPAINMSASATASSTLAIELLSSHSPMHIMGFVMAQLKNHLGDKLIPREYSQLPSLPLLIEVSQLFLQGVMRAELPSDDAGESVCKKIESVIHDYIEIADFLRTSSEIWIALFAQYEHHRDEVGRVLIGVGFDNNDQTINEKITHDLTRMRMMDALDRMEEKRLLLHVLVQFAFDGKTPTALHDKVMALPSKKKFLQTKNSELYQARNSFPTSPKPEQEKILTLARAGYNLNNFSGGGNVLPYIAEQDSIFGKYQHNRKTAVDLSYTALCQQDLELKSIKDKINCTEYNTWWPNNLAMRIALNCSKYDLPLLYIAAGFEGKFNYFAIGHLAAYASQSVYGQEMAILIASTLRNDGVLNRYKLQRAFKYYKLMTHGNFAQADQMIEEGVDAYCVLWLVALLGNWDFFEHLNADVEFAKTLGAFQFNRTVPEMGDSGYDDPSKMGRFFKYGQEIWVNGILPDEIYDGHLAKRSRSVLRTSTFTPLMVAAEHGRMDVVEGLISQHDAGHDIGITNILNVGQSAASMAFCQGYFDIAQRLYDLGSPLSAEQIAALDAKALPKGPLIVPQNPIVQVLEQSVIETAETSLTVNLKSLSSSVQHYANVFRYLLDSKARTVMKGIQKQSELLSKLNLFDEIVQRALWMSTKGGLSEEVIVTLESQQVALYATYNQLQAKLKHVAKAYRETYAGEIVEPTFKATQNVVVDEDNLPEIQSALELAYQEHVCTIAQDFGINFDKTLSLVGDAVRHNQQIQACKANSAVLFLGATGVGKSSLFNFMDGCLYKKIKKAGIQMRELVRGTEVSKTNQGGRSETRFPVIVTREREDASYAMVDLAGFLDNSDNTSSGQVSAYDIAAAISMKLISEKFEKISGLIAVCSGAQLTVERPPLELQETFRQIGRMIKRSPELADNVRLFITKHVELEASDVIERLRLLEIDFSDDEDISAFLQVFADESTAEGRIVFTDVVNDADRVLYFDVLDALEPQNVSRFDFNNHSAPLTRLHELLNRLVESRQALLDKIRALHTQRQGFKISDARQQMLDVILNFELPIQDDESLDTFLKEQSALNDVFEKMIQLDGLIDRLQQVEQRMEQIEVVSKKTQQLECQEAIERDFINQLAQLGLCDAVSEEYFGLQSSCVAKLKPSQLSMFRGARLDVSADIIKGYAIGATGEGGFSV